MVHGILQKSHVDIPAIGIPSGLYFEILGLHCHQIATSFTSPRKTKKPAAAPRAASESNPDRAVFAAVQCGQFGLSRRYISTIRYDVISSSLMSNIGGYLGAGLCLFGVLCALIGIGQIVNDISSLRDEVNVSMDEFRLLAEDTWDRLLVLQSPTGESLNPMPSLFRVKRYVYPGHCNCNENSQGCPAGPAGPPGPPGGRGEEGMPGEDGHPGTNGIILAVVHDVPGGWYIP